MDAICNNAGSAPSERPVMPQHLPKFFGLETIIENRRTAASQAAPAPSRRMIVLNSMSAVQFIVRSPSEGEMTITVLTPFDQMVSG